jgi:hypothetical protein
MKEPTSSAEKVLDFAMGGIAFFALNRASKARLPIVRVMWTLFHFPWLIISAVVWLPLEIGAFLWMMFSDAWHGVGR